MAEYEYHDEGPLLDWLLGIESALEGPLLDATDDELLFAAGQLDKLLVGDLRELAPDAYESLLDQLVAVHAASGSDAHERGFRAINMTGRLPAEEREVTLRLQAALGTELELRLSRRAGAHAGS